MKVVSHDDMYLVLFTEIFPFHQVNTPLPTPTPKNLYWSCAVFHYLIYFSGTFVCKNKLGTLKVSLMCLFYLCNQNSYTCTSIKSIPVPYVFLSS